MEIVLRKLLFLLHFHLYWLIVQCFVLCDTAIDRYFYIQLIFPNSYTMETCGTIFHGYTWVYMWNDEQWNLWSVVDIQFFPSSSSSSFFSNERFVTTEQKVEDDFWILCRISFVIIMIDCCSLFCVEHWVWVQSVVVAVVMVSSMVLTMLSALYDSYYVVRPLTWLLVVVVDSSTVAIQLCWLYRRHYSSSTIAEI